MEQNTGGVRLCLECGIPWSKGPVCYNCSSDKQARTRVNQARFEEAVGFLENSGCNADDVAAVVNAMFGEILMDGRVVNVVLTTAASLGYTVSSD